MLRKGNFKLCHFANELLQGKTFHLIDRKYTRKGLANCSRFTTTEKWKFPENWLINSDEKLKLMYVDEIIAMISKKLFDGNLFSFFADFCVIISWLDGLD